MPGRLWFGCGSAADERPLWLEMLGERHTRIVYWPFALGPEMLAGADAWLRGNLDALGADYELTTWESLEGHRPEELMEVADLLFVGGGNTFRLLGEVRRHGFLEPARAFWRAGRDYYGGSAGAVLACESIAIAEGHDPNEPGLDDLTGLGLFTGATILPHFTPAQVESAQRWGRAHDTTVIGMPESIGLAHADAHSTVIGAGVLTVITPTGVQQLAPGESFG
ncbi:Type 1 glutamine amidotransferase-like domain-containing protein [Pseudactinotalea suaedae]|uniref:Type 1 glutamine amidotransferase-like domain-containing protein n=1 Tax=Pseudactinotalea suaedae TaxID=1524924 RepID=UPI0012E2E928|nr:Type 1 glutamine amidotransferase-like domain-containing protein [Pseudactinotalea suaedae]